MSDLNGISSIYLTRFVGNGSSQLLCFFDRSSKTYETAMYLHTIKNDEITVSLDFLRQEMHRSRNSSSQG